MRTSRQLGRQKMHAQDVGVGVDEGADKDVMVVQLLQNRQKPQFQSKCPLSCWRTFWLGTPLHEAWWKGRRLHRALVVRAATTVLVTREMRAIAAATTTKKTSEILISTNFTCDTSCYAESHRCFTQPYLDIFTSPARFHYNSLISTSFCFIFLFCVLAFSIPTCLLL